MNRFAVFVLLGLLAVPTAWAQDNKKENILPPQTESKLMTLEQQVSQVERKWYLIDQKIRKMSNRIFSKNKEKAFAKEVRGRSVLTAFFDATQSGVFRVMKVKITLKSKTKSTLLHQDKRTSVTGNMNENKRIFQEALEPGNYTLEVDSRVQGYSPVFTYLNGYKLRVRNKYAFTVNKGQPLDIRVMFKDSGGMNMQSRLKILFKVRR